MTDEKYETGRTSVKILSIKNFIACATDLNNLWPWDSLHWTKLLRISGKLGFVGSGDDNDCMIQDWICFIVSHNTLKHLNFMPPDLRCIPYFIARLTSCSAGLVPLILPTEKLKSLPRFFFYCFTSLMSRHSVGSEIVFVNQSLLPFPLPPPTPTAILRGTGKECIVRSLRGSRCKVNELHSLCTYLEGCTAF